MTVRSSSAVGLATLAVVGSLAPACGTSHPGSASGDNSAAGAPTDSGQGRGVKAEAEGDSATAPNSSEPDSSTEADAESDGLDAQAELWIGGGRQGRRQPDRDRRDRESGFVTPAHFGIRRVDGVAGDDDERRGRGPGVLDDGGRGSVARPCSHQLSGGRDVGARDGHGAQGPGAGREGVGDAVDASRRGQVE